MSITLIHTTAFYLGLILIVAALVMSANRTNNWSGLLRFWEKKMDMNPMEFKLHRTGLVLMIAGVAISLISQLL